MILKYKTFKSSEELERFQIENKIQIFNVIPIYSNFKGDKEEININVAEPYVLITYCNNIANENINKENK